MKAPRPEMANFIKEFHQKRIRFWKGAVIEKHGPGGNNTGK